MHSPAQEAIMLVLPPADLPGNPHQLSPTNPTHVIGAARYRLSWTGVIEGSDPRFDALTETFVEPYCPAGTFGVAGLESQEHSVLWFGPADIVARFEADPAAGIPFAAFNEHGVRGDRWPNTDAWLQVIPESTWNPGGQGLVAEYAFDDAQVVVYELLARPALLSRSAAEAEPGPLPVVTFHCTRCHYEGDHGDRYQSAGPDDRRLVCRKARQHMQAGQCRGSDATDWADRMVATVEHVIAGAPEPTEVIGLFASRCQTREVRSTDVMTSSSCAEIREARIHSARHRVVISGSG